VRCAACLVALFVEVGALPPGGATQLGGQVHGNVVAEFGYPPARVHLPHATVFLKSLSSGQPGPKAVTDGYGRFRLPHHPPGRYQLCVEAVGFVSRCGPTPIAIGAATSFLRPDVILVPEPRVVRGRVLLADGHPCYHEASFFGPAVVTTVELVNDAGVPVGAPVAANSIGQYVLPKVPGPGVFTVKVACADAHVSRAITLGPNDLAGAKPFDLTLANSSPFILSVTLRNAAGVVVRHAAPGEVLKATVHTHDPDGDALHYTWSEGSHDAPTIEWKLAGVPAANALFVEATDGKGGFALSRVSIGTGSANAIFAGRVAGSAGPPLPGVAVDVNGRRTTTDAQGNFNVEVGESERYVVTVKRAGYALVSRVFHAGATALDLRLDRAQRRSCDPTKPCAIREERRRTRAAVTIEPHGVVDAGGAIVNTPFFVDIYGYDVTRSNPIPGNLMGVDRTGRRVGMITYGAAEVEVTDGAGRQLRLRPGAQARLSLEIDPTRLANAPGTIPLLSYDESTGLWKEEGTATRLGNRYEATVEHFSVWNVDTISPNTACIKMLASDVDDRNRVPAFPFVLHVDVPKVVHLDFPVTEETNLLLLPAANKVVTLDMRSPEGAFIGSLQVNSGDAVDPGILGDPQPPYDKCNGFDPESKLPGKPVHLTVKVPKNALSFLRDQAGLGSPAITTAYYTLIGALDQGGKPTTDRGTFDKWKATNNFDQPGEVSVVYYNNRDLQVAQDVHCQTTAGDVACYMTLYTDGGNCPPRCDPAKAMAHARNKQDPYATLAMEFSPLPNGQERLVKFFVFGPAGDLKPDVVLDTEGPKQVPNMCLACHMPVYTGAVPDFKSTFLPFDPFGFVSDGPNDKLTKSDVDAVSQLDKMVKATSPNPGNNVNNPIVMLIDGIFSNGPVPVDFVPPAWQQKSLLYTTVMRRYCRGCHIAWVDKTRDFTTPDQLTSNLGLIRYEICEHDMMPYYFMPHAQAPFLGFWTSGALQFLAGKDGLGGPFQKPCPPSP
jgi:hypothetical protein